MTPDRTPDPFRIVRALTAASCAALLAACGASEAPPPRAEAQEPPPVAEPAPVPAAPEPAQPDPAQPEPTEAAANAPEPPPAPEPAVVEAGARLGAIRIGMSEEEVRALGLPEAEVDPRSRRFGIYRVFFDARGVRRVEASMGELGRIRVGAEVLDSGTHIHRIRDAFGDCEWTEGGGERYRCAGGTLFVQTAHSMDPARYTVSVERR